MNPTGLLFEKSIYKPGLEFAGGGFYAMRRKSTRYSSTSRKDMDSALPVAFVNRESFAAQAPIALIGIALLIGGGCGSKKAEEIKRLNVLVGQQQREIAERQGSAEICEDLFEAEQQRYLKLERLTRMRLPGSLSGSDLEGTLIDLPNEAKQEVLDQFQIYQVMVATEFERLVQMNEALQSKVAGVERTVKAESRATREASLASTEEIRAQLDEHSERIGDQQSLALEFSGELEVLIRVVQAFEDQEISCAECWGGALRRKANREEKQKRFREFTNGLAESLTHLHRQMESASFQ